MMKFCVICWHIFNVLVRRKGVFNDFDVDFSGERLPAVHVLVPLRRKNLGFAWDLARFKLLKCMMPSFQSCMMLVCESCKAEEAEAGQPAAWGVGFARLLQRVKELSTEDLQEILRVSRCCVSVASQLNCARHVRTMRLDGAQWASSASLGRANVPILACVRIFRSEKLEAVRFA